MKDRIKSLRRVRAGDLRPNPRNWRRHGEAQRNALRGVLDEIGYADALVARELADGTVELIDGHLRQDEADPDEKLPVLILDVSDDEADKLLATLDPLAAMAETDAGKLAEIAAAIKTESDALREMLASNIGQAPDVQRADSSSSPTSEAPASSAPAGVTLAPWEWKRDFPPPTMSWALIGIPTVKWGDVAKHIEAIAAHPDSVVETVVNDNDAPVRSAE